MENIIVLLANGFEEIEALSIIDILRRAKLNVLTLSITDKKEVEGAHQVTVITDKLFSHIDNFDEYNVLILPGGQTGSNNLRNNSNVIELIQDFNKKNKWVCAMCAAPIVLAKAGIINNKKVTCYPGYEKYLEGAQILNDRVVVDKPIITSRGPATAPFFALQIVKEIVDNKVFENLKTGMLYSEIDE